jgi:hypothetical protein
MATELKSEEFTDRLAPIFESVRLRLPERLQQRNLGYFFPQWRKLMTMGFARTWEIPNAVLGCLFTPDIFGGPPQASVPFWFSLPGTDGTLALLLAAEAAAKGAGCPRLSISAYCTLEGERIAELLKALGYAETERVHQKELNE